ncbi:MAG TPA: DUF6268 family outer membrane beta-barrel protein [bacterium]|nr:DUF6268 family outer membrane beta-barrel protein [bacterium]
MKSLAAFLSVSAILLTAATAPAQSSFEKRIWRLLPERAGLVSVQYLYDGRSSVKESPPGKLSYHDVRVRGMAPIPLCDSFVFAPGASFDLHHFRLHDVTDYLNRNTVNLYTISLSLDAMFTFGEDWILDVNVTPTVASDLKKMGRHDWQFPGFIMAGWAFSDSAALLFGIAGSKEFWTYMPYPMLGFVIRPEGSFFSFESVLPSYVRADFKVASFMKLFLQGEFEGFVWDLKGDAAMPEHFAKLIDTRAGGGARFIVTEGLEIEVWGGVNPYRKLHFADRTSTEVTSRLGVGWFAQAGIIITPAMFSM